MPACAGAEMPEGRLCARCNGDGQHSTSESGNTTFSIQLPMVDLKAGAPTAWCVVKDRWLWLCRQGRYHVSRRGCHSPVTTQ